MVEKLSVQIALEGGAELQSQFAAATSSIAKLGNTAEEAFAGAAAAAQKFSASTNELAGVEGRIRALAARAKDGNLSFSELAANIDRARQSAGSFVSAAAKVEQALKTTGRTASETRAAVNALAQGLNAMGAGPAGRIATAMANIGTRFGVFGLAAAAVGVAITGVGGALVKFAVDATETEKSLTQLQKVSGVSFQNLSSLQQVFAAGGTPLKQFATEVGNLSEKVAEAGQQAAIRRADKDVVAWANDVVTVRKKFDDLNVGALSALTSTDTKVKALAESLSKVPAEDRWARLADIFKNLGSDLERAQIGKALGLSPESIATLTQGSEAIRKLQAEAERLGLTLTSSNQQALQQMAAAWNQFSALLPAIFQKIGAAAAPALTNIISAFQLAAQQIVSDFQNMPLDQAIANIGNRLAGAFSQLGAVLSPILSQVGAALGEALVAGIIAAVKARLSGSAGTMGPLQPGAPGFEGRAGGGLLGGRGTGTSDSNLAWVSRGEHIMPARAVAQPGVLMFLEALRRSGGNLSAVLNGMGRFALGGMVPRAMPAFASGGLAGGMSNVTIAFPGLPPIGGLRASSAVVDELHKAAALAQVRSGGRKPSRYF